jgi:hypothetical protein
MHPPRQFLLRLLDLSQSKGARAMCIARPKRTANPRAMVPRVHQRRSLHNPHQPFSLGNRLMRPPPQFLLHFLDLRPSNGARPICASHRKLPPNPGAMISPVHQRRSVDNLLQPFPLLGDRLMHPPPQLLLHRSDSSRSSGARPLSSLHGKLTANPSAMISKVEQRRSLGDLVQPFTLLKDRLMRPPPQFLLHFSDLSRSNGTHPTSTPHRKQSTSPHAMISPLHRTQSLDSLLQPFPQPPDRLMYPQWLPAI